VEICEIEQMKELDGGEKFCGLKNGRLEIDA